MNTLPDELILHFLSLCDPITLVHCRAVCKTFCKLIEESTRLQYLIELWADGMTETGFNCSLSLLERLSLLRSRRAAWKELRWSQRQTPMIPGSWSAYELVDGIFSKTLDISGTPNVKGILFTTLPSNGSSGSVAKIDNVGIPYRDFAMDPTQDLIVYMQCHRAEGLLSHVHLVLHFRTMSNNKPHPRAHEPFTSIMLDGVDILGAVIQTVNDVVGFMAWDHTYSQLYIWDWTQSTLLVSKSHLHRLDDFAFLSDRAYVLTSPHPEPCFRVYTFRQALHERMSPATVTRPRTPILRATLRFPQMHDEATASQLSIHTGPYTTTSQNLHVGPPKPFVRDQRCRIHIISLELWGPLGPFDTPTSYLVVVHNSTFLAFTAEDSDTGLDSAEPADLEWLEWGPKQTRWLPGRTGSSWLRYVHGERLVRLYSPIESGPHYLEVYDFGTPRGPPSWQDQDEEPVPALRSSVFTQPVVGRLPCRVVKKLGNFPYSGFMIDEERLIGLKLDFAEGADSVDVFTF